MPSGLQSSRLSDGEKTALDHLVEDLNRWAETLLRPVALRFRVERPEGVPVPVGIGPYFGPEAGDLFILGAQFHESP